MNNKHSLLATLLMLLLALPTLTSCHSNEQNYRAAYDKAMEKRREGIGAETYAKIEAEKLRNTTVVNGDSIRLMRYHANVDQDSASVAHRYNVVVANFKQRINARSYRDRLREEEGHPSYILHGGPESSYYVIVKGFDDLEEAAAFLKDINNKVKIKILEPKPWIFQKI